jgi:hypothetical protein
MSSRYKNKHSDGMSYDTSLKMKQSRSYCNKCKCRVYALKFMTKLGIHESDACVPMMRDVWHRVSSMSERVTCISAHCPSCAADLYMELFKVALQMLRKFPFHGVETHWMGRASVFPAPPPDKKRGRPKDPKKARDMSPSSVEEDKERAMVRRRVPRSYRSRSDSISVVRSEETPDPVRATEVRRTVSVVPEGPAMDALESAPAPCALLFESMSAVVMSYCACAPSSMAGVVHAMTGYRV